MKYNRLIILTLLAVLIAGNTSAQETEKAYSQPIFDDQMLLDGYTQKYSGLSKEILLEMIQDDSLSGYKTTAAVRVFDEHFAEEIVADEKKEAEKILLKRLKKTDSSFVQVEVMCALIHIDRYRYFNSMVPALIQKLNHYNSTVNKKAFSCVDALINNGTSRAREARVVFDTLRKILFLSRKKLEKITEPDERLSQKLRLLRAAVKILGSEELKQLPKEVMHLL